MSKKISVIEDDKLLRELITKKLQNSDYEVSVAADGEEGLEKLKQDQPDLLLLDLVLPGIDGFEVLENMKDNENLKEVPVVILSNLGQKDDIEKGMKLGAEDYLVKAHFTPNEIIEKVKEFV